VRLIAAVRRTAAEMGAPAPRIEPDNEQRCVRAFQGTVTSIHRDWKAESRSGEAVVST
jgi:hypothetical protein